LACEVVLLPSGWFFRSVTTTAVVIALLLSVDLLFPSSRANVLVSNTLDFAMVSLAAVCSFYSFRRASGFPRQIWLLVGIALALHSVAQAITTYYQSFVPAASHTPWPSDILFFVWPAPIFLLFLPSSDDAPSGMTWIRVLDFLQVVIVAVTAYLYFFFSPTRWLFDQRAILREILVLYIVRDILFALGFLRRGRANTPTWLRSFSRVLSFVFCTSALSYLTYFLTLGTAVGTSSWGDVVWMVPFATIILFAAYWKQPSPEVLSPVATPPSPIVASHFLPVIMPLLVIFMSYAIAREFFLLAWLAVTASVVCSGARLILANERQREIAANLLSTEKALRRTEQTLSSAFRSSPDAFSINAFPNGPYFEVNEGFSSLTGYSREDTIGRTPGELDLWVDPSERARILSHLTESGFIRDVEFRFRSKSGNIRFGNMSASLIDYQGTPSSLVMVRDITVRREAEEILRSSEERFRSLVQNLHVGILSYDREARIVYANDAVLDLLGITLQQAAGKTIKDLKIVALYEDGTPIPDQLRPVLLAIQTGLPQRNRLMGWRIPNRRDLIWTLLDAVPEFSSTGELSRVVVSFTNVTEQRRATEALRSSEERFRSLVENLHVGIATLAPNGRLLFANQALINLGLPTGSVVTDGKTPPVDQVVGKTAAELGIVAISEDGSVIPEELRPVFRVIATRKPIHNMSIGWSLSGRSDIVWTLLDAFPEFSSAGDLLRVVVSITDVTEQRRATEALRESEERFRTLVRDIHVAVVLHTPDGRIEFANRAALRMLELTERDVLGKTVSELDLHPIDQDGKLIPDEDRPVETVLRTRQPLHNVMIGLPRPDNPQNVVWIFGTAVPQFDSSGALLRIIASFSDITEMKNAERAIHSLSSHLLKLQDEERRRLGRELHDGLAQTVLAINLSLAQARQSIPPDNVAAHALDKARNLTQQISREIRTLSYLLHPPLLDDLGLVSALKEYTQGFSDRSGIDTQLFVLSQFDRLPQPVETALFRIVQESLANVQRHSGSTTAKIRLRQENSVVTLEIVDFGQGMVLPGSDLQADEARFGVGIPGMRERMALLGGSLDVFSGNNGTTVRATIPVAAPSSAEVSHAPSAHPHRG
jgi:PAS domain S-box-containing protein